MAAKERRDYRLDANGHSRFPQKIDSSNWYYEEKKGICVVSEISIGGEYAITHQVEIPWSKIRKSVERDDKSRKTKKAKKVTP
jgi:hypothetical protein